MSLHPRGVGWRGWAGRGCSFQQARRRGVEEETVAHLSKASKDPMGPKYPTIGYSACPYWELKLSLWMDTLLSGTWTIGGGERKKRPPGPDAKLKISRGQNSFYTPLW